MDISYPISQLSLICFISFILVVTASNFGLDIQVRLANQVLKKWY